MNVTSISVALVSKQGESKNNEDHAKTLGRTFNISQRQVNKILTDYKLLGFENDPSPSEDYYKITISYADFKGTKVPQETTLKLTKNRVEALIKELQLVENNELKENMRFKFLSSKEVKETSHDLNHLNTLNEQALFLASHALKIPQKNLGIRKVQPGLTSGASGQPVFLIFHQDKLVLVIKTKDLAGGVNEVNALRFIKNLNLNYCSCPQIIAHGDTKKELFIALSVAPGRTIDDYIVAAATDPKTFFEAKEAISATARGMAELHSKKFQANPSKSASSGTQRNRESTLKEYQSELKNCIAFCKQDSSLGQSGISIKWLENVAENMPFQAEGGSYIHGDLNVANAFYQAESPQLNLIDNNLFLESVDSQTLAPVGVAAYDFVYFSQWIQIRGAMTGLDGDQIFELQRTFQETYLSSMNQDELSQFQKEAAFMLTFVNLRYLVGLKQALELPDHPWKATLGVAAIDGFILQLTQKLLEIQSTPL